MHGDRRGGLGFVEAPRVGLELIVLQTQTDDHLVTPAGDRAHGVGGADFFLGVEVAEQRVDRGRFVVEREKFGIGLHQGFELRHVGREVERDAERADVRRVQDVGIRENAGAAGPVVEIGLIAGLFVFAILGADLDRAAEVVAGELLFPIGFEAEGVLVAGVGGDTDIGAVDGARLGGAGAVADCVVGLEADGLIVGDGETRIADGDVDAVVPGALVGGEERVVVEDDRIQLVLTAEGDALEVVGIVHVFTLVADVGERAVLAAAGAVGDGADVAVALGDVETAAVFPSLDFAAGPEGLHVEGGAVGEAVVDGEVDAL